MSRATRILIPLLVLAAALAAGCSSPDADKGAVPPTDSTTQQPPPASMDASTPASTSAPPRPTAPDAPAQAVAVSAEGLYPATPVFSPAELTVKTGANVTLTYTNNDLNPLGKHDWFLERVGTQTDLIDQGESTQVTFIAPEPGDYAYYCAVDTHRERGMEGVLHVVA